MAKARRPDRVHLPEAPDIDGVPAGGGVSGGAAATAGRSRSPGRVTGGVAGAPSTAAGLKVGVATIVDQLRVLPRAPGVYRMIDARDEVLYVGKARSLKDRVQSYTRPEALSVRIRRMVAATRRMEIITTETEAEALLLEANLIKRYLPPFNVLLRDDKSFPYILIATSHAWPQLTKHRGAKDRDGLYFGPFASAGAVTRTLSSLERAFLLRSCADTVFENRKRPCLLYQVKRCSAPCVGRITPAAYATLVTEARDFLDGRNQDVQARLAEKMNTASAERRYEDAAAYRDRIRALTQIQAHQDINLRGIGDADVIAAHMAADQVCVQVFFLRGGHNYGNRAYFPAHTRQVDLPEVLGAFVGQFYASRPAPKLVLLSHTVENQGVIADALSLKMNSRVRLVTPKRGVQKKPVDHARRNAKEALERRLAESASQRRLLDGLAEALGLETTPERIEVYDNSHVQGAHAVGAMIVAGPDGLQKSQYRKFTIKSAALNRPPGRGAPGPTEGPDPGDRPITPGDDYGMMREVLTRRFARAQKEDPDREKGRWPDLVLIDGGQGQLNVALQVLSDLGIDDVPVAAISKGPDRHAGRETFHLPGRPPFRLRERDPILYFLQRLRDEAHRFAIGAHRAKRSQAIQRSPLDEIAGIGPSRKRALLQHFGSARTVANAGLKDLEAVPGISNAVARKIYGHFHGDG